MQSLSVCTLDYGAFLNLPICNSDSWRGGGLSSTCQGASEDCFEVLLCGTSGRRKLYMMPGHSFHIYGICRSKKVGEALKLLFKVTMQAAKEGERDRFYRKVGFSALLKLYCKS